jgi:hypothetical protein
MMKKLLCTLLFIFTTIAFVHAQADINLQGNSVTIVDGDTTPDLADHTDFGQVNVGSSLVRTYTIQNLGNVDLNLTGVSLGLGTDAQFTIDNSSVGTPVPSGGSTTFTVTFAPTAGGIVTGNVVITSDSPAPEDQYTYSIQAEGIAVSAPDINLQGNSIDIVDGDTTPDLADHTDFGQVAIGSSLVRTYTIQNTGTADLNLTGVSLSLGTDTQFTIDNSSVGTPVPSGGSTTFTVTFSPTTTGIVTGGVVITSDDPDAESTYTYSIQAEGINAQDINVQGNNVDIVDGDTTPDLADHTDFGQITIGSNLVRTFTIQNTGNLDLNLSGVNLSLGTDSQFTIDISSVSTPVTGGGFTTFTVTFTPTVTGIVTGGIVITSDDPDAESTYTYNIQAEGIASTAPDINVQGNGIDIVDGDTTPDVVDDTDFGQVVIGSNLQHTFTIQNTGNADLNLTGVSLAVGTDSQFTIDISSVGTPVTSGGFTTFTVTFTPTVAGIVTGGIVITSDDPDAESTYTYSIQAEGIVPNQPEMDIFGNAVEIVDGDTTPDVADDTDFGQVDLASGSVVHTFTIQNNGALDLNLTDPSPFVIISGADAGDFSLTVIPSSPIAAAGSTTFSITFNPSALGIRTASVSIANDDSNENPYNFDIQGEGIDANTASPLLITQYYEGTGVNDKWIEVKNITSGVTTLPGAYHLALFEDLNGTTVGGIATNVPDVSVSIPGLSPGEVVLFRRSGATLTNTAAVSIVDTEVCRFNGNDIVLISTSNGANTYNDRIDIMGVVGNSVAIDWGTDTSLIKGCGTNEAPTIVYDPTNIAYDPNQYITLALAEVDNATANTNIQLGTQTIGSTIWTGSWDNNIPDKTKDAVLSSDYTNVASLDVCNLTINGGVSLTLDSGSTNYVNVEHNLTNNGTFTIGDTESLVVVDPDGVMSGAINKNERSAALNNFRDFTYWSSPVSTIIGQAFSGVDPNRIFEFDTPNEQWVVASGNMVTAKGYISEAPSSTPDGGTHSLTFSGTPNNGTLGKSIDFINDGDPNNDFNLIGNPYPSSIDIEKFILLGDNGEIRNNSAVDGTVWLWTHVTAISNGTIGEFLGDDYATYNLTGGVGAGAASGSGSAIPTKNIGSGQGFFVKAVSSGTVFFQNNMRLKDQNTQFFRAPDAKSATVQEKDRIWLHAESATGGAYNQLLVGFFDKATDGVDRGYDGERLSAAWINFYSTIDSVKYASQGLGTFNVDKKIPLGFDTFIDQPMTYKISIDNIEGVLKDNEIYLVDHDLDIVHDLRLADYEFDVDGKGNFLNRFTLQFNKSVLGVDDLELNNNFVVINEENALRLKSSTVITNIKVYDMTGRLLIDKKPNDSEFTLATSAIRKGTVLILNATFDNGAEVSKKAIKY